LLSTLSVAPWPLTMERPSKETLRKYEKERMTTPPNTRG